jgi:curved DNA-binding protein CbpA
MKPLAEQSYYEILDLPVSATRQEIDHAFERAMAFYGPDSPATYTLVDAEQARELVSLIEEAYLTLSDSRMREAYDRDLSRQADSANPAEIRQLAFSGILASSQHFPSLGERDPDPAAGTRTAAPEQAASPDPEPESLEPASDGADGGEQAPPPDEAEPPAEPGPEARGQTSTDLPRKAEMEPAPPALEESREAQPPAAKPGPKALELPPDAVFNGELLRRVREAKDLSLREMADRTRISSSHLENIEADRYDRLPATVYLRGFLMSIARELRLDPLKISKSYLDLVATAKNAPRS